MLPFTNTKDFEGLLLLRRTQDLHSVYSYSLTRSTFIWYYWSRCPLNGANSLCDSYRTLWFHVYVEQKRDGVNLSPPLSPKHALCCRPVLTQVARFILFYLFNLITHPFSEQATISVQLPENKKQKKN